MNNPLINILTRTSGRPNYFKRCRESVVNQTYSNIRHIVSVDDNNSVDYIKECEYIKVDKFKGTIPPLKKRRPAPYNLYFNDLHKVVNNGWILYLDDDDIFSSNNSVFKIAHSIKSDDDLILWRVNFKRKIVPEDAYFGKKPQINHFASNSFVYNCKFKHNWGFYSGGDFDYISILWEKIPNKIWLNEILTSIQREDSFGGKGSRDDLKGLYK